MMPKTPWGEQVDLILNPIGILGRMNMGQLFELYCGLISRMLARHVIKTAKSKADIIKIIGPVLSILDSTKKKEISGRIISGIRSMSDAQAKVLMQQIKTAEGIPIIVPPFKNPAYKEIYQALKYMKLQPAYNLTLPRYGGIKTHYGVPFGYIYVSKLEHIGEMKLHARATGPTTSKTLQPTAGKRRDGGQKMGEGDTWALIGYNAPYTLAECFGPLSDDVKSKNEIIADVIQKGYADYREPQASPTKNLLNSYFTALLLQEI
jgi:DNA-directed RNA polymerase subunit beta